MRILKLLLLTAVPAAVVLAQAESNDSKADRATAYYQYSLAHLYGQLAAETDEPQPLIDQAIEAYKAAISADPRSALLAEEMTDFYVQTNRAREAQQEAQEAINRNPDDLAAHRMLARLFVRQLSDQRGGRGVDNNALSRAIEEYQAVVRLDPQDVDSLVLLGRLQRIVDNTEGARDAFDKALGIDPNNEDALTGLATLFLDLQDPAAAAELFQRVAENNPTAASLQRLASTYEQMGESALAAETIRKALALDPPNADELRQAMARDLLTSGDLALAAEAYGAIVEAHPDDVAARLTIVQLYAELGDYGKARIAMDGALETAPDNFDVRYAEAGLLQAEGRLEEAVTKIRSLVSDSKRNVYTTTERDTRLNLLERLALLYRMVDNPDQAVAAYREMIAMSKENELRITPEIINTYRGAKKYDEAEQAANEAIARWPDDRAIVLTRALLIADLGRVDEAAAAVRKLLGGEDDRGVYLALAEVYDKGRRFDEAQEALDEAETRSLLDEEKIGVWFMRGAVYERSQNVAAAEAEFRKVLDRLPEHAQTLNYLGYMLADRNMRLNESLDLIEAALKRDPNNGAYLDSLGWVYYRMGRYAEAEEEIRKAVDVTPADPTMFDHYADVLIEQGKVKEAVNAWEEALRQWQASSPSDQDPEEIQKVQQKLARARQRLNN